MYMQKDRGGQGSYISVVVQQKQRIRCAILKVVAAIRLPNSVFVITAYELRGKPLIAYRRRRRRRKNETQ